MTPNIKALQLTMDHIEAHPEKWNQGTWIGTAPECGTVACFAGWTCMLAGDQPVMNRDRTYATMVKSSETGLSRSVSGRATEILGLSRREADLLFDGSNSLSFLRNLVAAYTGRGSNSRKGEASRDAAEADTNA